MFKKLISIGALVLPMFLVACGGGGSSTGIAATGSDGETTTTTSASYAGTYSGNTTGVNGGPTSITIASDNTLKGTFTINNRTDDNGNPAVYEATFDGKVSLSGTVSANAYLEGALVMIFSGQINSSGALSGTYYEAAHPGDPAKSGSFSLQGPKNGSVTTTSGGSASSCTGSYVGAFDPPSHEERIRLRNQSIINNGGVVTGDDSIDNVTAGGGGVDGGIYMTGSYSFETDASCNVVKGTALVGYVYQYDVSGKVNSNGSFSLIWSGQGSLGEFFGQADANGTITGEFHHPAPDSFVYGTLNGKFTPNGKI